MITDMLNFLKSFVTERREALPGVDVFFEFDDPALVNVKIDTVPRMSDAGKGNYMIYTEPPLRTSYELTRARLPYKQTQLRTYFCGFTEMQATYDRGNTQFSENDATAITQLQTLDSIERDLATPFIQYLLHSPFAQRYPDAFATLTLNYMQLPRFDANEVSMYVDWQFIETLCFEDYAKN